MNKLGLIVAMEEELNHIRNIVMDEKENKISDLNFIEGKIEKRDIVLVKCGVGKVNAARVTQIMIDKFQIEEIINIGSAGALNSDLNIGDVIIGKELIQHDFDITAFGHKKGYITGIGDTIASDNKIIEKMKNCMTNVTNNEYKIKIGIIASGDIFCTEPYMKEKIYSKFNADCVEMEGAAIAQVCYLDNIPLCVVRSISDTPNGNNSITFEKFVHLAAKRCAIIIKEYCKSQE